MNDKWKPPHPHMRLNRGAVLERSQLTPAIKVAGVPVHAYVEPLDDGNAGLRYVVSVHCDWEPDPALLDKDGNVRLRITVNGDTVFDA